KRLPLSGDLREIVGDPPGVEYDLLMRVAYTDKGTSDAPPLTDYRSMLLRNPYVPAYRMYAHQGMEVNHQINQHATTIYALRNGAYISLGSLDLTGITKLKVR